MRLYKTAIQKAKPVDIVAAPFSYCLQQFDQSGVRLTENMGELDLEVEAIAPAIRLECEFPIGVWRIDGRELEEVAGDDELYPAPHFPPRAEGAGDELEAVEELAVDHGDLVDDERLGEAPALEGGYVAADFVEEEVGAGVGGEADSGK